MLRELVPGLVSCCATLEVLHCPWSVFSALPATCPAFPRLNELALHGSDDEAIDLASPAWGVVANGRLPALATLDIYSETTFKWSARSEGEGLQATEAVLLLARAFEAVAGTLKLLALFSGYGAGEDDLLAGACYELGAAIGKLRRLRHLELFLNGHDGRAYHAVGRGGAASGGCPELFTVEIGGLHKNVDWLTYEPSLIVPSVRDLSISGRGTEEEALLLCCGLVQMGCKHRLMNLDLKGLQYSAFDGPICACMSAILGSGGVTHQLEM
jgi:hypothetical protein